jgi:hypothetical protein
MSNEYATLPEPTRPDSTDQRRVPRFAAVAGAVCRLDPPCECNVVLVNVSVSGARLLVRMREEPPTLTGVVLRGRSGTVLELRVREVYAQLCDDAWVVGCAFRRRLSAAELRDLLAENAEGGNWG